MASSKYKLGLVSIAIADIAGDGGPGTVFTAVGDTVAGTAALTTEEAQKTDFKIEESDSPVLSIKTEADTMNLVWSTFAYDAATLQKMFGGTVVPAASGVGDTWNAPDSIPEIEKTIKITWKQGGTVTIPRAKITASLNMAFKRDSLSQIDISATVLQPTKAGVPRMIVQDTV
jgi:hypothetical protein